MDFEQFLPHGAVNENHSETSAGMERLAGIFLNIVQVADPVLCLELEAWISREPLFSDFFLPGNQDAQTNGLHIPGNIGGRGGGR